jgi:hypothetical protein
MREHAHGQRNGRPFSVVLKEDRVEIGTSVVMARDPDIRGHTQGEGEVWSDPEDELRRERKEYARNALGAVAAGIRGEITDAAAPPSPDVFREGAHDCAEAGTAVAA